MVVATELSQPAFSLDSIGPGYSWKDVREQTGSSLIVRIGKKLTEPLLCSVITAPWYFWEMWDADNKCHRFPVSHPDKIVAEKPKPSQYPHNPKFEAKKTKDGNQFQTIIPPKLVRYYLAWIPGEKSVKILQVAQSTVADLIKKIIDSPDWGQYPITDYRLRITATGDSDPRKMYTVLPVMLESGTKAGDTLGEIQRYLADNPINLVEYLMQNSTDEAIEDGRDEAIDMPPIPNNLVPPNAPIAAKNDSLGKARTPEQKRWGKLIKGFNLNAKDPATKVFLEEVCESTNCPQDSKQFNDNDLDRLRYNISLKMLLQQIDSDAAESFSEWYSVQLNAGNPITDDDVIEAYNSILMSNEGEDF